MPSFSNSIWVESSVEEVFNFFTDINRFYKAINNVLGFQKLTDGEIGVGTKIKTIRNSLGKGTEFISEIMKLKPYEEYSIKNVTGNIEVLYNYVFKEKDNKTFIEFIAEVTMDGFSKLKELQLFQGIKEEDYNHLYEFKSIIESKVNK